MARIRFRQRQKWIAASAGAASALLICAAAGIPYVHHIEAKYQSERSGYEQQIAAMDAQRVSVYALTRDIKAGEAIAEEDLAQVQITAEAAPDDRPKREEVVGRYTKVALTRNTPISQSMLYEGTPTAADLRNQEFRLIELPSRLQAGEYMDVRVKFPTGEDFIVLSKKKAEQLASGTIWLRMDEQEILRMSSAIVDAYLNDASIYAVTYVEPGLQRAAIVTYPANASVLDLIDNDPNIIERAKTELERRMREKLDSGLDLLTPEEIQKYLNNKANLNVINPGTQDNSLLEQTQVEGSTGTAGDSPDSSAPVSSPQQPIFTDESNSNSNVGN
ncbi:hypothetical protein B9G55_04625 [Saccharibacillus sp. O16]|nr:hypothetical protein B9G55_04625 [Saccharibacillus sp. O16]